MISFLSGRNAGPACSALTVDMESEDTRHAPGPPSFSDSFRRQEITFRHVIPNPAPSRVRNLLCAGHRVPHFSRLLRESLPRAEPKGGDFLSTEKTPRLLLSPPPNRLPQNFPRLAILLILRPLLPAPYAVRPHPTPNAKTPSDHRSEGALLSQVGYN